MVARRARTVEGSCWPCKGRRVACDLHQPECKKCVASKLVCEYGKTRLRWVNGAASRGRLAGQGLPNSTKALIPMSVTPAVTTERLLVYFDRMVVTRFNLSAVPLSVDLAALSQDQVVQSAVMAVANAHYRLDGRTDPSSALVTQNKIRGEAIENFRKELARPDSVDMRPDNLFMVTVLLCVLDGIIEPTDENEIAASYCHFQGGKAILSKWEGLGEGALEKRGLAALTFSVFVTIDLIQSLLSGQETYFEHTWWIRFAENDCWWGCLGEDDPYLDLMSIMSRLAHFGHQVHTTDLCLPLEATAPIQRSLDKTDRHFSPTPSARSSPSSEDSELEDHQRSWAVFCSGYRLAAQIYLYRALCNLPVDHELVQEAAAAGVTAIAETPMAGKLGHCLLFPTLIVGAHCIEPHHQDSIRRSLKETNHFLAFGGIQVMEEFLLDTWKKSDYTINWWDCYQSISRKTFLF